MRASCCTIYRTRQHNVHIRTVIGRSVAQLSEQSSPLGCQDNLYKPSYSCEVRTYLNSIILQLQLVSVYCTNWAQSRGHLHACARVRTYRLYCTMQHYWGVAFRAVQVLTTVHRYPPARLECLHCWCQSSHRSALQYRRSLERKAPCRSTALLCTHSRC